MEFRLLGPLDVYHEGRRLPLGGPKQRAALAVLLLHANELVTNEQLSEGLWDSHLPENSETLVRIHLSKVRRALLADGAEPRLLKKAGGYELRVLPEELDLELFERLTEAGKKALSLGDPERAAETLRKGLALWRGPPLADLAGEPVARADGARLDGLRRAALLARLDADFALGRHEDLLAELEALVAAEPYHERFRAQLMLALYRSGRQADALDLYRQTRGLFVDQLGIEPSESLQRLQRRILRHDSALEPPPQSARLSELRPGAGRRALGLRALRPSGAIAAVGVVALACVAAVATLVARGAGGQPALHAVRPNSVGIIDPRTNRLVGQMKVGHAPTALAANAQAVWVASAEDGTLSRIDTARRAVTRTIGLGVRPADVAVRGGRVWVASSGGDRKVVAIESKTGARFTIELPAPTGPAGRAAHVATTKGAVWIADGGDTLFRIEPGSGVVGRRPLEVPNGFGFPGGEVAAYRSAVWVADPHGNEVSRVDVKTKRVQATIVVGEDKASGGGGVGALAAGEGAVWALAEAERTLWRIDPDSNALSGGAPVGRDPRDIAVGDGAVWVANGVDGTVSRIDPSTDEVVAVIQVGGVPKALAVAAGVVWIAVGDA